MKQIVLITSLLLSRFAFADQTVLKCSVPSEKQAVTMEMTLGDDQTVDFVTLTVNQNSEATVFFTQFEKNQLNKQMTQGFVNFLALTEQTTQVDGVIMNSGFLALSLEKPGTFSGLFVALGNVYPLLCEGNAPTLKN